jgi:hypothetical protein
MRTNANRRTATLAWPVPLLVSVGLLLPAFDQPVGASGNSRFCQAYTALAKSHLSGTSQTTLRRAAADFEKLAAASPRQVKKYAQLLAQDELKVANGKAATVNNSNAEAASNHLDAFAQKVCQ